MSADDGFIVSRLSQPEDEYGIFYYMGEDPNRFTRDNARRTYSNPVHAILAAHKLQAEEMTEYGVSVRTHVLTDTSDFFEYNTNEILSQGSPLILELTRMVNHAKEATTVVAF